MNMIINFVFMFVALYLCICLGYSPFIDSLTRPLKRITIETLIASIIFCLYGTIRFSGQNLDSFGSVFSVLFVVLGFVYYRRTINEGLHKVLFVFAVLINTAAFIGGLRHYIWVAVGGYFPQTEILVWQLLDISMRILLYPVIWYIFKRWLTPLLKSIDSRNMAGLWVVPILIFTFSFSFVIMDNFFDIHFGDTIFTGISVLFNFASYAVYILLLRILNDAKKRIMLESDLKQSNSQLELRGEHYKLLHQHIEETKRARHDIRHHLSVLQSFIDTGETGRLKAYIDEYRASLPDDIEVSLSANYAVNSILRYYIGIAKNEGISVDTRLELPENPAVSDADLCIVFGNCVENAIEACQRAGGERFIRIKSIIIGDMLAVTIDNSFDGILNQNNNTYQSRKHNGEGIGISSVKAVARKYGGDAKFESKANVFQASVILRVKD